MQDASFQNAARSEQREVTLLFADLRGFTELAATLRSDAIVGELLAQVMDNLTESVVNHDGHIVDYYGDGLVAMWNAPTEQAQHPELACQAALGMLKTLPEISADWIGAIPSELRLGIGVHTGTVQVGNAGSARHVKYGPRGPNVHLARRAEAATKELRLPLIVTLSTAERLSDRFDVHRVCRARMPGLPKPVELFAVRLATTDAVLAAAWQKYAHALRQFERGHLQAAAMALATIEPTMTQIPLSFLQEQVQRELGRGLRRRSTDRVANQPGGVIAIHAK